MQNAVTNTPSHSLHSFPQQPHYITLHFPTHHLPILVSLIYQFQEQFTDNTSKADSLTSFHFLLKTLPAVLTSETLTMAWARLMEASSSLLSNAFYFPPPVSVCHLPLTHSQILTLCRKEPFSFCACCTTHWTRELWTFR